MNPRVILAIARKDLIDAVRNLYILFGITLPLGVWLLFQLIMPAGSELKIGPVAVYDQGSSKLVERLASRQLVERVIPVRSLDDLTATVRKEAVGGLVLPADLDEALAASRTPEVTMLMNRRRGGGEQAAFRRLVNEQLQALSGRPPVAHLVERDVDAPAGALATADFSIKRFTLLILLVLGLAMTGTFVVPTLLVEEKEKGTLKAILVSPANYVDVAAGKALVGLFYALLLAAILLAVNDGLHGDVPLLVLAIVLGALFLVEVGLLLGAVFSTSAQVNTWSSLVMMVLLAPTFTAGIVLPEAFDMAMRVVPTHYFTELVMRAGGGSATESVWTSVGALLACIAVFFAAIVWSLRRAER